MTLHTPTTVAITSGGKREVQFTAPVAGTYYFESSNRGSLDPTAYDALTGGAVIDDDSGTVMLNYKFQRTLNAGQTFTFYSGVYGNANVSGSYTVTVTMASEDASTFISDLRNARAACFMWFGDNADHSETDLRNAWNNTTMIPIIGNYMDNPEKVRQLDFVLAYSIDRYIFLVGKSADASVINEALNLAAGSLLKRDGVTPVALGDTIAYMRVR
jgi:hypothetical protein